MIKTIIHKIKLWWYRKKGYNKPLVINKDITVLPEVYTYLDDIKRKYLKNMLSTLYSNINTMDDANEIVNKVYLKNVGDLLNARLITMSKLEMNSYSDAGNYVKLTYREKSKGPNSGKEKGNLIKYLVFIPNRLVTLKKLNLEK